MSPVFVLRAANAGDAEAIGRTHAQAWQVAYADLFDPDVLGRAVEQRRRMWASIMSRDWFSKTTLLVAELDHTVVGFAHFGPNAEGPAQSEIFGFYLDPSKWGSGAASVLMTAALDQLAESSFEAVCLWTHRDAQRARRFYAKSGFAETGRTKEDHLVDGPLVPEVEYIRAITSPGS